MLYLYSIFHLNLSYSSIDVNQRHSVVQKCYWPLLKLVRKLGIPVGIEVSGFTLETINDLDSSWVSELRSLLKQNCCEFVGSGYTQLIGPLIPAEVNRFNLKLGRDVYTRLLDIQPEIAMINEQAYSSGLVDHYLDDGYKAIVMEWDNPARFNPRWKSEWRYFPQYACSQSGRTIALIWNNSISFQKFQRYAHGEIEIDEYIKYLTDHIVQDVRSFSLYGNDAEIFNFRPGRYHTEAQLGEQSEWDRIALLYHAISEDSRFKVVVPSKTLDMLNLPNAGNQLALESPACPVPVKKQGKYNITRWAVSGRDDLVINTACWKIYESLKERNDLSESHWKELCYLWSSDFRTHITDTRWMGYQNRLKTLTAITRAHASAQNEVYGTTCNSQLPENIEISRDGRFLSIRTASIDLCLNCRRGLAVDRLCFNKISDQWLCGTLHHGYFDDIQWGADYYTGHLVLEAPGRPKVTDLNAVDPEIKYDEANKCVSIQGTIDSPLGAIHKRIDVFPEKSRVSIRYFLNWKYLPVGTLRLGNVTLNPDAFNSQSLFFRSSNGGTLPETFYVDGQSIDHSRSVSFLVSAEGGFGITDGKVDIGDSRYTLRISKEMHQAALIGMVKFQKVDPGYFYRLILSASEVDETSRNRDKLSAPLLFSFSVEAMDTTQKS